MGTWSVLPFGNDGACDWSYELEKSVGTELISKTLRNVLDTGSEYLDASLAEDGVAACEVVARMRGQWGTRDAYTETVDKWVESCHIPADDQLVSDAIAVVDRVMDEKSELKECWNETDEAEWGDVMNDLRNRLTV